MTDGFQVDLTLSVRPSVCLCVCVDEVAECLLSISAPPALFPLTAYVMANAGPIKAGWIWPLDESTVPLSGCCGPFCLLLFPLF